MEKGVSKRHRSNSHESEELCVSCSKSVCSESIQCQWCGCWEHQTCAKLSSDEFKCLLNCSSKITCIRFYCSICHPKVDAVLQFF